MAVDSNVLILNAFAKSSAPVRPVVAAVDAGFSKAFLTIIDTHVTTVVSCAFLFIFWYWTGEGLCRTWSIGLIR